MGRPAENPPRIQLPHERDLGPAMKALTVTQRAYVVALPQTGGNQTQAAILAGVNEDNAKHYGYMAKLHPKIQAAMREWAEVIIKADVFVSTKALLEIAMDPLHKDRLKAAIRLQELNGMQVVAKSETTVKHEVGDTAALVSKVRRLAQDLGMDGRLLLTQAGVAREIIDAEFQVVSEPATVASSQGLEDLL